MKKIGVMQGRICPSNLNELQIFPLNNWQSEIKIASEIGFSQFEILFDKDLVCIKEFSNEKNIKKLNDLEKINKISASSICIDYFSSFKTFSNDNQDDFIDMLMKIFKFIKKTSIKTIVIPYCDNNNIDNKKDLMNVLNFFLKKSIDDVLIKKDLYVALEINLSANEIVECFDKFSFSNIGICFDIGNSTGNGFLAHKEILILDEYIKHIHIKDKPINGENVMLGKGSANFKECIKSLEKINYENALILETIYYEKPEEEVSRNFNYLKKIFLEI